MRPKEVYLTKEESCCEDQFLNTYSRDPSGKFILRLPFKEKALESLEVNPSESYILAFRTFCLIERKFEKDEHFKQQYHAFMKKYEDLGHVSVLPQSQTSKDTYFIPHDGVIQGKKKLLVLHGCIQ